MYCFTLADYDFGIERKVGFLFKTIETVVRGKPQIAIVKTAPLVNITIVCSLPW